MLSHAAGLIASTLRDKDIAGRVGGEEFCVVLPGMTLEEAAEVAEQIRERIDSKEILIKKSTTPARECVVWRLWCAGEGQLSLRKSAIHRRCASV